MKDKLTKEFEELIVQAGGKIVMTCLVNKNGKCEENHRGHCYYCGRPMLEDDDWMERKTIPISQIAETFIKKIAKKNYVIFGQKLKVGDNIYTLDIRREKWG